MDFRLFRQYSHLLSRLLRCDTRRVGEDIVSGADLCYLGLYFGCIVWRFGGCTMEGTARTNLPQVLSA